MTEEELIKGCVKKEYTCQRLLFDKYAGKMMSLCLRFSNNEHDAQDILQEGFIKAFDYIHQFKFEGSFEGWLRRVFISIATRQVNKRKLNFKDIDVADSTEAAINPTIISRLSENEIHALIRSLPDGYRLVFNLSVIDGYSHEEIGTMLGIQASTSRTQLLKARKALQQMILKQYNAIEI